jgi:hypothetical protein
MCLEKIILLALFQEPYDILCVLGCGWNAKDFREDGIDSRPREFLELGVAR